MKFPALLQNKSLASTLKTLNCLLLSADKQLGVHQVCVAGRRELFGFDAVGRNA